MNNSISLGGTMLLIVFLLSFSSAQSNDKCAHFSSSYTNVDWTQPMVANTEVKQSIVDLMKRMSRGVENRALDDIMEIFALSPDVVLIGSKEGKIARGTDQVRALFKDIVSSEVNTRLVWNSYTINATGDVAWLFALAYLIHEDIHSTTRVPYRVTGLFVRINEQWKWLQYHGSEPIGN